MNGTPLSVPAGYENETPLPEAHGWNVAQQCRELNVKPGDAVIGRVGDAFWAEARLTLLWCGRSTVVWSVTQRSYTDPQWTVDAESTAWDLFNRRWYRVKPDVWV